MSDNWTPTHRHYKGGFYRVTGLALHTETGETLVIYDNQDGTVFARPKTMFQEMVPSHPDGAGWQPRFAPVA